MKVNIQLNGKSVAEILGYIAGALFVSWPLLLIFGAALADYLMGN